MADRSNGEIWIGGKIKRELVPDLCNAICAERVWLSWSGEMFHPQSEEDLLEGIDHSCGAPVLHFSNDEAVGGEFYDVEEFLRKYELSYTRHSARSYYYDGRRTYYRAGHAVVTVMTNVAAAPVITRIEQVERAWYLLKEAQQALRLRKSALELLTQAAELLASALPMELPRLEPFKIGE